jgi:flagellar basal-body rod protein FlgG
MQTSLFTAATGMRAQQMYVDNIANNLANVNTTGFKRSRLEFQDLFYNTLVSPGSETVAGYRAPTGLQIGSGVRQVATTRNFAQQGLPQETKGPTDIMISGQGFFQITQPGMNQTVYTRAGSFSLNGNTQLVTADGYLLSPQITIPSGSTNIGIGTDGTVSYSAAGSSDRTTAGKIQLVTFPNAAGLEALGGNLFTQTPASGTPTTGDPGTNGLGQLQQGWLEGSNVDVVTELINLIIAQRAYEVNSRAIRTSDNMLEQVNGLVR